MNEQVKINRWKRVQKQLSRQRDGSEINMQWKQWRCNLSTIWKMILDKSTQTQDSCTSKLAACLGCDDD